MPEAIKFEQVNEDLGPPQGHDCDSLPIFRGKDTKGNDRIISKWQFTKEEIDELAKTGCIYLYVLGQFHPAVAIETRDPWGKSNGN